MDSNLNSANIFNSASLVNFINHKKKHLIIITIIAFVISAIISFLVPPKYQSSVVLFPASSGSISHQLLTQNVTEKNIMNFGEEEEVEQLIQILNSDEIRNKIIKKFDLMSHYKISPNSRFPRTELYNKFIDNISFIRTEYMSVRIEVLDRDPQIAADIANDIALLIDTTINRMQRERAQQALKIVEKDYLELKNQIRVLEDSLSELRALGINDYESQSEVFNTAYVKAIASGNKNEIKFLEEKIKILSQYGGAYVSIRDFLIHEKKQLSETKEKYAEAKVDAEQNLPHKYIVNFAYKAEKETYPIKWLIIITSTSAAFFLALVLFLLFEIVKKKNIFLN
jgi:capsular polysaccharide biosynthesis protein